jgi:hypothetical protein
MPSVALKTKANKKKEEVVRCFTGSGCSCISHSLRL